MNQHQLLYGGCVISTGLLAGLFYGYQCSVINGLGRLGDKEYISAFQQINKAILNPVFFLTFIGSIILLLVTTYVFYRSGNKQITPFLTASMIIYGIGVIAVTAIFNVPMNEKLALINVQSASMNQIQEVRDVFETNWNRWHLIRTIAAILSFILLIIPLLRKIPIKHV